MAVNVCILSGTYIHLARYTSRLKIEINKIQNTYLKIKNNSTCIFACLMCACLWIFSNFV